MTDTLHEEAARYALLRRVAPTLRHHMAGEFQQKWLRKSEQVR